jgi:hypothetical protein
LCIPHSVSSFSTLGYSVRRPCPIVMPSCQLFWLSGIHPDRSDATPRPLSPLFHCILAVFFLLLVRNRHPTIVFHLLILVILKKNFNNQSHSYIKHRKIHFPIVLVWTYPYRLPFLLLFLTSLKMKHFSPCINSCHL